MMTKRLPKYSFKIILLFIISLFPLVGWSSGEPLRILIPKDVLGDYHKFLNDRDVLSISSYAGPYSRRDVVEVVLLQQAFDLGGGKNPLVFVEVDSYKRILKELQSGRAIMSATTSWLYDLEADGGIYVSEPMIKRGEFVAGLYVNPTNSKALTAKGLGDVRALTAVSSEAWRIDWNTLSSLKLKRLDHTVSWTSMVKMVHRQRVDFLLAPFQQNERLALTVNNVELIPIPGLKVGLKGSRHFAVTKNHPASKEIFQALNTGIAKLKKKGVVYKAYLESGFFNRKVVDWINITELE